MSNKITVLNYSQSRVPARRTLQKLLARLCATLSINHKEIELVFLNDEQIRPYYKDYFGEDRPTDVIAFPLGEGVGGAIHELPLLGSIVISVETAKRQARERRQSLWNEIRLLIIHGLLHLLGHDHAKRVEADRMRKMEQELLEKTAGIS